MQGVQERAYARAELFATVRQETLSVDAVKCFAGAGGGALSAPMNQLGVRYIENFTPVLEQPVTPIQPFVVNGKFGTEHCGGYRRYPWRNSER